MRGSNGRQGRGEVGARERTECERTTGACARELERSMGRRKDTAQNDEVRGGFTAEEPGGTECQSREDTVRRPCSDLEYSLRRVPVGRDNASHAHCPDVTSSLVHR